MATFGYLGGNEDFHHNKANNAALNLRNSMAEWRTYKKGPTRTEIGVRLAVLAGRILAHIDSQQDPDIALKTTVMQSVHELERG